jgi:hypothetical protein
MYNGIELIGEAGVKIVAGSFGFRAVIHSDGPLQPARAQFCNELGIVPQGEQKFGKPGFVKQGFIAVGHCRPYPFQKRVIGSGFTSQGGRLYCEVDLQSYLASPRSLSPAGRRILRNGLTGGSLE